MNIQDNIRRILREGMFVPPFIKIVIDYVDKYINDLDSDDVCTYWVVDEIDHYVNSTMSDIVRNILDTLPGINNDNYSSNYTEIYGLLEEKGYKLQIGDFFNESMDNCGDVTGD